MSRFVIVLADAPASRVDRGETLFKFLRRYEPATRCLTSAALADGPVVTADVALVGFPTALSPSGLERLRASRLVTFDYFDEPEPDREAPALAASGLLPSLSMLHLKTHRERVAPVWAAPAVTAGLDLGLLPIRYNRAVAGAWRRYRLAAPWRRVRRWAGAPERAWDVSLHGSVTRLERRAADGAVVTYDQRVPWAREMRAHPTWRHWGGLHPLPYRSREALVADHGPDVVACLDDGPRMPFLEYFARMAETRVALCPAGHARWTYRHIEAAYAGCEIVSTDLAGIETLVPAPVEAMTLVPDHAPIGPAVSGALAAWPDRARRRAGAVESLQGWLDGGRFVTAKRRAFEAFVRQLEDGRPPWNRPVAG